MTLEWIESEQLEEEHLDMDNGEVRIMMVPVTYWRASGEVYDYDIYQEPVDEYGEQPWITRRRKRHLPPEEQMRPTALVRPWITASLENAMGAAQGFEDYGA